VGASGISGDAQTIVDKCRIICLNHESLFKEHIGIENLMERICSLALKFSENDAEKKIFNRPYGVSLLVAGWDNEPVLYSVDPSGSYLKYKAKVIGSTHEILEASLEREYDEEWDLERGIKSLLEMLRNVMKDKISKENVEVTVVTKEGVRMLDQEEICLFL